MIIDRKEITRHIIRRYMASDTRPPSKNRAKVQLKPGFHLTDWVRLSQASQDLSGKGDKPIRKISMKELSEHKTKYDCWIAYNGRVYNVSPYLPYHPGGEDIILQWGGKDCTKVFNKFHAWVNCDSMLGKCYLGPLGIDQESVAEDDAEDEDNDNDDMKNGNNVSSVFSTLSLSKAKQALNTNNEEDDDFVGSNNKDNNKA